MNTNELKQYLSAVVDLEKNIHIQKSVAQQLTTQKNELLAELKKNTEQIECSAVAQKYDVKGKYPVLPFIIAAFIFFMLFMNPSIGIMQLILGKNALSLIIGLAVPAVVFLTIALIIKGNLERSMNDSNKQKAHTLVNQLTVRNNDITAFIPSIDRQFQQLQETYKLTYQARQKVYAKNIIPPDYRDLVPVCMFLDYITNGRTHTITEDPSLFEECAVNIYERELFQQLILGKLDAICSRLDTISENQRMLYDTINECNRSTNRILSDIGKKIDNLDYHMQQRQRCTYYVRYY